MIEVQIKKYEERYQHSHSPPASQYPYPQHQVQQNRSWLPVVNQPMDKLNYAMFIGKLPYKKGDFVSFTNTVTFTPWNIWIVGDIIEIHHMVKDWGNQRSGPLCTQLLSFFKSAEGYRVSDHPNMAGALLYKKVDHSNVPDDILEAARLYWQGKNDPV